MPTKSPGRCRRRDRVAAIALAVLAACGGAERAVERRAIEIERGPAIRESGDTVLLTDATSLGVGPAGQLVALGISGPRLIAFYDSTGALLRMIGPRGKGPGEFMQVGSAAVGPGDSLHVGDATNGRISVFSPSDSRVVRTIPATWGESYFVGSPEGRLLGPIIQREASGMVSLSPRRAAWDGSGMISLAAPVRLERFGTMAPSRNGRIWVADRLTYTLTLFDGDRPVRTVRREVDWFPPDTSPITSFAWMGKGRPFITSMSEDDEGNLWVLLKRKNPSWNGDDAAPTGPVRPGGFPPLDQIFEGVLEVLGPNGELLDSRVVAGDMIRFLSPGRLYQKTDADSSGALMLQVWHARLARSQ